MAHLEMWWLIGSALDFWGSGPGFESDISHNGPTVHQDNVEISGQREKHTSETTKDCL